MTKFDIKVFQKNKTGNLWEQTFTDGTIIQQSELEGIGYILTIGNIKSPFTDNKVFSYQGELLATSRFFHAFPVGISINYDGQGNIFSKVDNDQIYPFSLDQLIKKMRTEFNIDLLDREKVPVVGRYGDQFASGYTIYVADRDNQKLVVYFIGGVSGEVLATETAKLDGNHISALDTDTENLDGTELPIAEPATK